MKAYNSKANNGKIKVSVITPIQSTILPSLSDGWLSGLTDSEGGGSFRRRLFRAAAGSRSCAALRRARGAAPHCGGLEELRRMRGLFHFLIKKHLEYDI